MRNDLERLFDKYNRDYFSSRLPPYKVSAVVHIPGRNNQSAVGFCYQRKKQIHLLKSLDGLQLRQTLLHEMAHAATNPRHGPKWAAEMKRLHVSGAPVKAEECRPAGRVTRHLVKATAEDALGLGGEAWNVRKLAKAFVNAHGHTTSSRELLKKYPWVVKVFKEVLREFREMRQAENAFMQRPSKIKQKKG